MIWRVASSPFSWGIARSITTTSGFNASTRSTASRPLLASPHTFQPPSFSSSERSPWRTTS
jgi:hypothetical protein